MKKVQDTLILLEDMESRFGRIRIYESSKDGSRTFYQDSCYQSRVDANGQSLVAYIHAMQNVLLQAGARKVLVLGCAGGTLATMLVAAGCEVTIVDINPYSFELAKRWFYLPPQVECVVADAREYLEKTLKRFDGIAMDVFDNGEIPFHLRTVEFFQIAASRLGPQGVLAVNAIIDHDLDLLADHLAASMKEATGKSVALLDHSQGEDRNIVVVAGRLPDKALLRGDETLPIQEELQKMRLREIRQQSIVFHD